jgi:fimbrial chaperone protein
MDRTSEMIAVVLAAIFTFAAPNASRADSLEVAPTTIMLGRSHAAVLNVMNRSDEPITAQVEAFDWTQDVGRDRLVPSRTLQVSPPVVRLVPGRKQIVRLRATLGAVPKGEKAYRLLISELPSPSRTVADGVRMLLQFNVPVFVGGNEQVSRKLRWRAMPAGNDLIVEVRNEGATHVKLAGLHVAGPSAQTLTIEPEAFYYVLSGAAREWKISDAGITAGATLHIEGVDEANGTQIDATVVTGH